MYNFKNWVDRVTQFVNRFKETNNSDGSITHERVDGEVLKTGTSQSAANFNNMEGGILENSLLLAEATRVLKEHGLPPQSAHAGGAQSPAQPPEPH